MATVRLAGNGFGGLIQGAFGAYQAASDGSFTVDTRDTPALLAMGMSYITLDLRNYTTPKAPLAATAGAVVASGALSDGVVVIAAQPDVPRPLQFVVGAGTAAITAGTVAVAYVGNDGQSHTDILALPLAASGTATLTTSYGVVTVSSVTVAGLIGGASPFIEGNTTAALALPIGNGAIDTVIYHEYDAGAAVAVGTAASSVGCITPTTAPVGTVSYSFVYGTVSASQ